MTEHGCVVPLAVRKWGLVRRLGGLIALTLAASCVPVHRLADGVTTGPDAVAAAVSVPLWSRADLDSATAPCHDFYQYATGGWYRRIWQQGRQDWQAGLAQYTGVMSPLTFRGKEPPGLAGTALVQLVAHTPELARTSADPTLRIVGLFYGSCLRDTDGAAPGAVGDTSRAGYCFRATRQYLDRALFELFMEHVWPAPIRAESRRFWIEMKQAAAVRFQASTALSDSTKQRLVTLAGGTKLLFVYIVPKTAGASASVWQPSEMRSGKLALWEGAELSPPAGRGPAELPFADDKAAATWTYRNYSRLELSPTDFRGNVTRLHATLDPVPLPIMPETSETRSQFLDVVLHGWAVQPNAGSESIEVPFENLIPPLVDGRVDLSLWSGMVGEVMGHEMGHLWEGVLRDSAERQAFIAEQFHGQLPPVFKNQVHAFDDEIGALVAYDAFKVASRTWSPTRISGFTPEQRFFLGLAMGWRGGPVTITGDLDQRGEPGQTRWRIAVNGALSALPAFASAFGCTAASPMAGGHVWYKAPWYDLVLTSSQRDELAQDYEALLQRSMREILGNGAHALVLTPAQQAVFAERRKRHDVPRRALAGMPGRPTRIGTPAQFLELLGQELGEVRAVLPPDELAKFDSAARAWVTASSAVIGMQTYTVEIPGLP